MGYQWPPVIPELGEIVKEYINSGLPLSIADESGIIKKLEQDFATLHGMRYALTVSSGTMALYSAFFAVGLSEGDEVICTAYSYHATAAPLLHLGVRIVFCDVEIDTGNIDATLIESLISSKTKAVITNDQWGYPCNKDKICAICQKYGLIYIEDCSHAHFSEYQGRYTGTFGDVSCFSLQGRKLLSGGEGGLLMTNRQDIYERAVLLGHNLKRPAQSVKNPYYKPLERTGYGLKLRMHPLAALIADYQLNHYCFDWIKTRTETLNYFQDRLKGTFLMPMQIMDYVTSMGAWYGFMPRIKPEYHVDKVHFVLWMQRQGLEASIPKSKPLTEYELFFPDRFLINSFPKHLVFNCENAQRYHNSLVSFPTFSFHEYDIIDQYITDIYKYMEKFL